MKLFSWFDATDAKTFGVELALAFTRLVPIDSSLSERKFTQKADSALKRMGIQITEFKSRSRLNTYKKAQLGNSFKWQLLDQGYEAAYVDQLTEWVLERL